MTDLNPEFATNQEPRCACVLLLDTSGSMAGASIQSLNEGLSAFENEIKSDPQASLRVDVAVVSFSSEVRVVQEFVGAQDFVAPVLAAGGLTFMASGVERALELLAERNRDYDRNKILRYRPWIMMITDGRQEGPDPASLQAAAAKVQAAEAAKRVAFFAIGTASADFAALSALCSAERPPTELASLRFRELFVWLSRSLGSVAKSVVDQVGQQVPLEPRSGWSVLR